MDELDLKEFFIFFKKRYLILVFTFLIFLIGGYVYCKLNKETTYETKSTLVIFSNSVSYDTNINNITINENLNKTLYEFIKSKKVFNKVIKELKLDLNYSELSNRVNITLFDRTGYIEVVVKDNKEKDIINIANKIVEVFNDEINNIIENNNIIINVVDEAIDYEKYSNISNKKIIGLTSLSGIFAGFIVIFILYYFNNVNKR